MTWVPLVGILVSGVTVPFIIAYLHRKQARQIEAYRKDPSVGLKPPLHPISRFFKNHYAYLLGMTWYVCFITREMLRTTSINREGVLIMALYVGGIFFLSGLEYAQWIVRSMLSNIRREQDAIIGALFQMKKDQGRTDLK
jgi:hypothetical protein